MRIINGKKFYKKDMDAAIKVASKSSYNGRNYQWYTINYHQPSGYCEIIANNSGDCYGDYVDRYYDSPESMYNAEDWKTQNYAAMIGELDEMEDDFAIKCDFMAHILKGAGKELVECPKARELLGLK